MSKEYNKIPIIECKESLVPIPEDYFIFENPPPYQKLGADYQGKSPFYLREKVLESLVKAQENLQSIKPNWKIKIFDAYRPITVQKFMVEYTFKSLCQQKQLNTEKLSPQLKTQIYEQVYQFWAVPSENPLTPPPHSTGSAIDITLINNQNKVVNMGGEIDEVSQRSHPNYYANSQDKIEQEYHQNRELLYKVMKSAGFQRHQGEWWHFCQGDQMWAWLSNRENCHFNFTARYGRVD